MEISKTEMAGGALLYHAYMPWSHVIMSGVLVKAGTSNENWPGEAGLAHASEHMRFQGTEHFFDSGALSAYMEDIGGAGNAWTSNEGTCFYQCVPALEFERSPFVSSQLALHAVFPEEKIKIEMANIVQEIKRAHDDHRSFLYRKFIGHLYGNHVLARDVLGNEQTVKSFTRDNFIDFGNRLYNRKNFVFIVAGNVSRDNAVELFEQYFSGSDPVGTEGSKDSDAPKQILPCAVPGTMVYSRDVEQVHLQIGYLPIARQGNVVAVLDVFSAMIDGGMSFPLFQIVRDKHGLCYEIDADTEKNPELCHFEIYVGTDPQKYQKAEELILKIVDESKTDANLLKKAKDLILGRLAFAYDGPISVAGRIADGIIESGRPKNRQEIIDTVNAVKIEEVEETVNEYLNPSRIVKVMLKPQWLTISD